MATYVIACRQFGTNMNVCPYRKQDVENCFECNMCIYVRRQAKEPPKEEIKEDEHTV